MSTEENGREDITPEPGYNGFSKASREEREDTLTRIMRNSAAFPALIKTGHVLTSIDLLNKMDGLYSVPFGFNDNRTINIICDEKTKDLIAGIGERTKALPSGDAVSTIQKEASGEEVKETIKDDVGGGLPFR